MLRIGWILPLAVVAGFSAATADELTGKSYVVHASGIATKEEFGQDPATSPVVERFMIYYSENGRVFITPNRFYQGMGKSGLVVAPGERQCGQPDRDGSTTCVSFSLKGATFAITIERSSEDVKETATVTFTTDGATCRITGYKGKRSMFSSSTGSIFILLKDYRLQDRSCDVEAGRKQG